jgi:YHS domain-containing protein
VAYFTDGAPTKGKPRYAFTWNDAEWRFTSAEHRDVFAADPERYAPQFGGFCSMAMSNGVKVAADPHAWTIVDGKLYLKVSKQGVEKFRRNAREYIERAEENWVRLKSQE